MEFPLKWQEIFEYVGFPAFLKPHDGGGWKDVFHVHGWDDFFHAYDKTRDLCMTLQAAVKFKEYFRCYVVGQEDVRIMPYDPSRPHHERYVLEPPDYDPALLARVEKDALTLCRALGYDLNTVEFAVEDGIPYAIDFMNPAPDADYHSVGPESFEWIVDKVAKLAVKKAQAGPPKIELRWASFLNGAADRECAGQDCKPDCEQDCRNEGASKEGSGKESGGEEGNQGVNDVRRGPGCS